MIKTVHVDETWFTSSIAPAGMPLEEGEAYIDFANLDVGPFRARHGHVAGTRNRCLAQADTPADYWDQLIRQCAERSGLIHEENMRPSLEVC